MIRVDWAKVALVAAVAAIDAAVIDAARLVLG